MHPKKLNNVFNLPPRERFEHFIKHVADFEVIWGLKQDDGWATTADNNGQIYMPFWSEKEFAELCANGDWEGYYAKSISLNEFINNWLPGMERDNIMISIFPNYTSNSIVINSEKLLTHLQRELENYE